MDIEKLLYIANIIWILAVFAAVVWVGIEIHSYKVAEMRIKELEQELEDSNVKIQKVEQLEEEKSKLIHNNEILTKNNETLKKNNEILKKNNEILKNRKK